MRDLDVLLLTESRIVQPSHRAALLAKGLKIYGASTNPRLGARAGGAAIIVHHTTTIKPLEDQETSMKDVECAAVAICPQSEHDIEWRVASVYVHPVPKPVTDNHDAATAVAALFGRGFHVVGGDFNARHPSWDKIAESSSVYSHVAGKRLYEVMTEGDLQLMAPARLQPTTTAGSTLDLIIAQQGIYGEDVMVKPMGKFHSLVAVTLTTIMVLAPPLRASGRSARVQWDKVTDRHRDKFAATLPTAITSHDQLAKSIVAATRCLPGGQVRRHKRKRVKRPPDDHLRKLAHARGPFVVYNVVFSVQTTPPEHFTDDQGNKVKSRKDQANMLVDMYGKKHESDPEAVRNRPRLDLPEVGRVMQMRRITRAELRAAIASCNMSASPDPEHVLIRTVALALTTDSFCDAVADHFSMLLSKGLCPASWRRSVIVPILKALKPEDRTASYRPVALTSWWCRIFERIILWRLYSEIGQHLPPEQSGFRRSRGTDEAVAALVQTAKDTLRRVSPARKPNGHLSPTKHKVVVAAVDFSDAFCRIDPTSTVRQLLHLGCSELLARWILQFLSNRTIRVMWCGTSSRVCEVDGGSPQGSILGPVLWNVMMSSLMNDLRPLRDPERMFAGFADDLTLLAGAPTVDLAAARVDELCAVVTRWARANGIPISTKSEVMAIGVDGKTRRTEYRVSLGPLSLPIKESNDSSIRVLGCHLDPQMRFGAQVDNALHKFRAVMDKLAMLAGIVTPSQYRQLYLTMARPHLMHGSHVWWNSAGEANKKALIQADTLGARRISGCIGSASGEGASLEAGLLPLAAAVVKQAHQRFQVLTRLESPAAEVLLAHPPPLKLTRAGHGNPHVAFREFVKDRPATFLPRVPVITDTIVVPASVAGAVTFDTSIHLTKEEHIRLAKAYTTKDEVGEFDLKRIANAHMLADLPDDNQLWTDGSVMHGETVTAGSAALLFLSGDEQWEMKGGGNPFMCSYTAEWRALELGLILAELHPRPGKLVVISDSRSVLQAMECGPTRQRDALGESLWLRAANALRAGWHSIEMRFIFSHTGLPRSDRVDTLADEARSLPQDTPIWATDEARAGWQIAVENAIPASFRTNNFGTAPRPWSDKSMAGLSPAKRRLLAQLSTGACTALGGWAHGRDPEMCQWCGRPELSRAGGAAVKHAFECPAALALRTEAGNPKLAALKSAPVKAVAYMQRFIAGPAAFNREAPARA